MGSFILVLVMLTVLFIELADDCLEEKSNAL